jgi:hypothetical protein
MFPRLRLGNMFPSAFNIRHVPSNVVNIYIITHRQRCTVVLKLVHDGVGHADILEHTLQFGSELAAALRLHAHKHSRQCTAYPASVTNTSDYQTHGASNGQHDVL